MKLTRRELASVLAPAAAAVSLASAEPAAPPAESDLDTARARIKANGETLAKLTVPMDLEPSFQFKA